jgi:conjugative transfer signal peptidase TraF
MFCISLFIEFCAVICGYKLPYLYLNHTQSLPRGIYLYLPCDESEYKIGDKVIFDLPQDIERFALERGYIAEESTLFLKEIGALEGDCYETDKKTGRFYAAGKYIGQIFEYDSQGRDMPRSYGKKIVPKGDFLPVSEHSRSFDGRYVGTVPVSHVKGKAYPLFVEIF